MLSTNKQKIASDRQPNFAHPHKVVQSWYLVGRSREFPRNKVRGLDFIGRRIVFFRGGDGKLSALDAACPHLGADLSEGRLEENSIRCAFHGWRFDNTGACVSTPGAHRPEKRKTRAYPLHEDRGLVYLFNGPRPLFDPPSPFPGMRTFIPPRKEIKNHPHVILPNGLDQVHFETLHGLEFVKPPELIQERYTIKLNMLFRIPGKLPAWLSGTYKKNIRATFSTLGGGLAWADVYEPYQFNVLFSGSITGAGTCRTGTVFFVPRNPNAIRAVILMYALLGEDARMLENLKFTPGFTQRDQGMRAYSKLINRLKIW